MQAGLSRCREATSGTGRSQSGKSTFVRVYWCHYYECKHVNKSVNSAPRPCNRRLGSPAPLQLCEPTAASHSDNVLQSVFTLEYLRGLMLMVCKL